MDDTIVNTYITNTFLCLEPEVGKKLLPRYPEFLSDEEKARFELHLEECEYCQERLKLWRATGLAARAESFLEHARALLEERHYKEAIAEYNRALELDPHLLTTEAGQAFFQIGTWLPLTAARSKDEDIWAYLAPSYAPEIQELAAAKPLPPFPIVVEYADGKVKGTITALGRLVFFELLETSEEFETGVTLVGRILQPVIMLKAWEITRGEKQKLGTIASLFGSAEFPDVVNALRTFRVFPG